MDSIVQDVRFGARTLARRPVLSVVAIVTLALGIGSATAIFSVADAVILRPLAFAEPDRLVLMWQANPRRDQAFVELSYPAFRHCREQSRVFEQLAGMNSVNGGWLLTGRGEPDRLAGRIVTGEFFTLLGVHAALGRTLVPEDDRPGAAPVVVLSDGLWRGRFGADPSIIGQSLTLDGQHSTVVGVMPRDFAYPKGAQLWVPLVPAVGDVVEDAGVGWMIALGRLRPGVSLEGAQTELTETVGQFPRPLFEGAVARLTPLSQAYFGPTRPLLVALLGAVGLVLLIACANVAGLLLVQATERGTEMAVRHALGATRARLARALMTESLLLAFLGGGAGLVAAHWGIPALVALSPQDVPRLQEAGIHWSTFGFAVMVSLVSALLSGLAPVLALQRVPLDERLRRGSGHIAPGRNRARAVLVVAEVALALVLLVGAGLVIRSLLTLRHVPLGFQAENLMTFGVSPGPHYDGPPRWRPFFQELLARVEALPGIESAAVVNLRPLWGTVGMDWIFTLEGQSREEASGNPYLNMLSVSAGYFRTMGIPVKRGRAFTDRDTEGQPGVAVVSEILARRCWPGQDPVGRRIKIPLPGTPYDAAWLTVVGVVADTRYRELQEARLDFYMSYLQSNHALNHLMVRTRGESTAVTAPVREIVRDLDRHLPLTDATPMARIVAEARGVSRFAARIFGAFAIVAVFLASLGLYGLLAYSVALRTREIGVRKALGARTSDIRRLVLGEGVALTLAGAVIGLAGAGVTSRLLGGLLYEVAPLDPTTFAGAFILVLAAGLCACWPPARTASRVQSVASLRQE